MWEPGAGEATVLETSLGEPVHTRHPSLLTGPTRNDHMSRRRWLRVEESVHEDGAGASGRASG